MKYEITLVSKDNNTFIYYCSANSDEEAGQRALNKIVNKGWDIYQYKITRVRVKWCIKTSLRLSTFLKPLTNSWQKKVHRLVQIEKSKKRGKLPLPLIKEKFEITSKILSALRELTNVCRDNNLIDLLNGIGILT